METTVPLKMKKAKGFFFCFLVFFAISSAVAAAAASTTFEVKKSDFPPGFLFGAGTSALQVEGAASEDGRKQSIWDIFTHSGYGILDNRTGDIAADQYHKYKEDVKLMHDVGLDAYRFSISWSRLIPDGRGPVNPKGSQYYNNLINELVGYGIEPHVTLYHFDLPQALQNLYEGLISPRIIEDYTAFANVCFKEFGDRVKNWITFNEPNLEPYGGYDKGIFPPRRCSKPFGILDCSRGDSTKEPYIVAHHILLSHLSASMLYKEKYQALQGGKIGITIMAYWYEPLTKSKEDILATERTLDFHIGWIVNPLVNGDYPKVMKERVGSRLPSFNFEESNKLKSSFNFIGINHYSTYHVHSRPNNFTSNERDYIRDISAYVPGFINGDSTMIFALRNIAPINDTPTSWALEKLLDYMKVKYKNPPIVIHENGYGESGILPNSTIGTRDEGRIKFLQEYMKSVLQSVRKGSNTRGYFVWSFIDCFELIYGYTSRFGLIGIDFNRKDRRRYPRLSAYWYAEFLNSDRLRRTTRASNAMHDV